LKKSNPLNIPTPRQGRKGHRKGKTKKKGEEKEPRNVNQFSRRGRAETLSTERRTKPCYRKSKGAKKKGKNETSWREEKAIQRARLAQEPSIKSQQSASTLTVRIEAESADLP